jgi:hypothetical protein
MAAGNADGEEESEDHKVGVDVAEFQRYAVVTIPNDEVVIYDQDDENAWIQSDTSVRLESSL